MSGQAHSHFYQQNDPRMRNGSRTKRSGVTRPGSNISGFAPYQHQTFGKGNESPGRPIFLTKNI